jgi:mono/diheme cytochrome c family protein
MGTVRRLATLAACAALAASLGVPGARAKEQVFDVEDGLLKNKCTLCHTIQRLYAMDAAQMRDLVRRMQLKNPDWITEVDSDHVVAALAKVAEDPSFVVVRRAWKEAVARGEQVFSDRGLGAAGKSCADCHAPGSLHLAGDSYPQYDPALGRFVTLEERVNLMIQGRQGGAPLAFGDQRLIDLVVYLRTLR